MAQAVKRVYIDMPARIHAMLKKLAADKGIPMKVYLENLINQQSEQSKHGNTYK